MIYSVNGSPLAKVYGADGSGLSSAYDIEGTQVFSSGNTLKVMTYNVGKWGGYNAYTSVQDLAFGCGADIVGIQEWASSGTPTINGISCAEYLEDFGFDYLYITSEDVNHKAIVSKYAMTNMAETAYAQYAEKRSYTKSYFTKNGKTIAFFNTHLDTSSNSAKQFAQVQELLLAVENEEYFILTGDFNSNCSNKEDAQYINIIKPFVDEGYNVANGGLYTELIETWYSGKTVETSSDTAPADNIITSANIVIANIEVQTSKFSFGTLPIDHIPLIADLIVT